MEAWSLLGHEDPGRAQAPSSALACGEWLSVNSEANR